LHTDYIFSHLVNTSGSGKTRILIEGLLHRWGFYFTFARGFDVGSMPGENDNLGSADMSNVLERIQRHAGFTESPSTKHEYDENKKIAQ
jgi:hypothetical protein